LGQYHHDYAIKKSQVLRILFFLLALLLGNQNFDIVDREYTQHMKHGEQKEYPLADFVKDLKKDNDQFFKAKH